MTNDLYGLPSSSPCSYGHIVALLSLLKQLAESDELTWKDTMWRGQVRHDDGNPYTYVILGLERQQATSVVDQALQEVKLWRDDLLRLSGLAF